jgi:L-fucono-1,5-lactonase
MATVMYKIDSHHHFWKYDPVEYDWITEDKSAIRRDFGPADLAREMATAGVSGVISVQAQQSLDETRTLLDFADNHDFIRGVVGWVPLIQENVSELIAQFVGNPKLRALRHVLQDEPDPNYMLREDFNRGIAALREFGLVYDILIFERHLPQTIQFVDRHPDQVFVLDHLAKPLVKAREMSPWAERIAELAKRPNVYCKISGLATEADYHNWTEEQLKPYIDVVLESFGPKRLMFGSDWPVCLVAVRYADWAAIVDRFIGELSQSEQERIWSGTAVEAYRLA